MAPLSRCCLVSGLGACARISEGPQFSGVANSLARARGSRGGRRTAAAAGAKTHSPEADCPACPIRAQSDPCTPCRPGQSKQVPERPPCPRSPSPPVQFQCFQMGSSHNFPNDCVVITVVMFTHSMCQVLYRYHFKPSQQPCKLP